MKLENLFFVVGNEVFIKLISKSNSHNLWTVIDLIDLEKIESKSCCWYARITKKSKTQYAVARTRNGGYIFMHRFILQPFDERLEPDHKNRDGLDNRRENLRLVTHVVNNHNKGLTKNNTSKVKGVTWDKDRNKWHVMISINKKHINIGRFRKKEDAIAARIEAEIKYAQELQYV